MTFLVTFAVFAASTLAACREMSSHSPEPEPSQSPASPLFSSVLGTPYMTLWPFCSALPSTRSSAKWWRVLLTNIQTHAASKIHKIANRPARVWRQCRGKGDRQGKQRRCNACATVINVRNVRIYACIIRFLVCHTWQPCASRKRSRACTCATELTSLLHKERIEKTTGMRASM
jgi:hypothetical protein